MSQNEEEYDNNGEVEDEEDDEDDEAEDDDDDEQGDEEEEFEDEEEDDEGDDQSTYGEDEDDEDDDLLPPPEEDYDIDPEYSGVDPTGQPVDYYQPEYSPGDDEDDEEQGFKDELPEKEKRRYYDGTRCIMILSVLCCCIILILILVLILYFTAFKKSNNGDNGASSNSGGGGNRVPTRPPTQPAQVPSPRAPLSSAPFSYPTLPPSTPEPTIGPTFGPTFSPAPTKLEVKEPTASPTKYPTIMPTKSPAPTKEIEDSIVLIPIEDTYIVDGFEKAEPHGEEDTFLIQNALDHVNEIPDAFALLKFDMSSVPFARVKDLEKSAILELTHDVSIVERDFATYTVERLVSTSLAVESLHLGIFPLPEDGIKGTTFNVAPDDEKIEIDVTDLIFGGLYDPEDDEQALLMLVNYGEIQEAGDRFRTRESPGNEPKLRLSLKTSGAGGTSPDIPEVAATVPPTTAGTSDATSTAPSSQPTAEASNTEEIQASTNAPTVSSTLE